MLIEYVFVIRYNQYVIRIIGHALSAEKPLIRVEDVNISPHATEQ